MCLNTVDCLFSGFSDYLETLYALTEDTAAQPLKTYYVQDGSAFTALVEGTDYRIGDPVPAVSWYEKISTEDRTEEATTPLKAT